MEETEPFTPRVLLDRLSDVLLARLYRYVPHRAKLSNDDEQLLACLERGHLRRRDSSLGLDRSRDEDENEDDGNGGKRPHKRKRLSLGVSLEDGDGDEEDLHMTPGEMERLRGTLVADAETRIRQAGVKVLVGGMKLADLRAALAPVPIDHGENNPRNKPVVVKRLTEVLCRLGPMAFARRYVRDVELMTAMCRASGADEASLEDVLTLVCTDLEMDDGNYATEQELEAFKLEELQRLLEESVYKVGLDSYLRSFSDALLRAICRRLGVEPSDGRNGKLKNVDKLLNLIFERLHEIRSGRPTIARDANEGDPAPADAYDLDSEEPRRKRKHSEPTSSSKGRSTEDQRRTKQKIALDVDKNELVHHSESSEDEKASEGQPASGDEGGNISDHPKPKRKSGHKRRRKVTLSDSEESEDEGDWSYRPNHKKSGAKARDRDHSDDKRGSARKLEFEVRREEQDEDGSSTQLFFGALKRGAMQMARTVVLPAEESALPKEANSSSPSSSEDEVEEWDDTATREDGEVEDEIDEEEAGGLTPRKPYEDRDRRTPSPSASATTRSRTDENVQEPDTESVFTVVSPKRAAHQAHSREEKAEEGSGPIPPKSEIASDDEEAFLEQEW